MTKVWAVRFGRDDKDLGSAEENEQRRKPATAYKLNNSRSRFVWERLTGISVFFRSSIRN
jgi:hypothetical protein